MQSLIWNKEKAVKEELLKTYWVLFFDDKEFKPQGVGKNLIELFKNANLTQLTSLEEIVVSFLTYSSQAQEGDKKKEKGQGIYKI